VIWIKGEAMLSDPGNSCAERSSALNSAFLAPVRMLQTEYMDVFIMVVRDQIQLKQNSCPISERLLIDLALFDYNPDGQTLLKLI
jgi:hypothetical protein